MDGSAIVKQLRLVIRDLYDDEGNERETPRRTYISGKVKWEAVILLREIVRIVLSANYFTEVTKEYIMNSLASRKDIADKFNMNQHTVQTKIYRDTQKFKRDFGEDCLYRISTNPNADLTPYRKKVQEFSGTLQAFYDAIDLHFKSALGAYSVDLDSDSFDTLCQVLTTYSKKYKQRVADSVPSDSLGYINYLFSKEDKTDEEEYRFNKLLAIVGKLSFSSLNNLEIYREIGYSDSDFDGIDIVETEKNDSTEADKIIEGNLDTSDILTDVDDEISDEELMKDLEVAEDISEEEKPTEEDDDDDDVISDEELERDLRGVD